MNESNSIRLSRDRACASLRALIVGAAFLAACRKTPPAPPSEPVSEEKRTPVVYDKFRALIKSKGLSPEREKWALEQADDMERQGEQGVLDRKELVTPAPPGFKPEAALRKIRLTLTLEKSMIRRGDAPRFRLEMTNVGSESIRYGEIHGSFFKFGVLSMSRDMQFILIPPGGKEIQLYTGALGSGTAQEVFFPADWSEEKKARAAKEMNSRSKAEESLSVELVPGETLRTRGDVTGDLFRTLAAQMDFSAVGTYRIRVKFDDRLSPLTEGYIEKILALSKKRGSGTSRAEIVKDHERWAANALGPVESDEVRFEVVP
jgi:hypothetical protein